MRRDRSFHQIKLLLSLVALAGSCIASARAEIAGVVQIPVQSKNLTERKVSFDLHPSQVCNFGDLDLLLNDFRVAEDSLRLQLSVELLGAKERTVVYGQPLKDKLPGENMGTYVVNLPKGAPGAVYGVYLCSVKPEELGKVPCSKKDAIDFAEAFKPYTLNVKPLVEGTGPSLPYVGPTKVEPKIYFTQFLADTGTSVWAFSDVAGKTVSATLNDLGAGRSATGDTVAEIERLYKTIGSLPLRTAEERVQIVLPVFSDKKCNG